MAVVKAKDFLSCKYVTKSVQAAKFRNTLKEICDASLPNSSSNLHYRKVNITTFLIRLSCLLCPNAVQFSYNLHNLLWLRSSASKLCVCGGGGATCVSCVCSPEEGTCDVLVLWMPDWKPMLISSETIFGLVLIPDELGSIENNIFNLKTSDRDFNNRIVIHFQEIHTFVSIYFSTLFQIFTRVYYFVLQKPVHFIRWEKSFRIFWKLDAIFLKWKMTPL